jgi:hypothetical protein
MIKGFIYEIKCNETDEVYIGSTIKSLKDRMRIHTQNKNCSSIQIIERNNYQVNILEYVDCNELKDLRIRERFYYDKVNCINKVKPYSSIEEKKEAYKLYQKQYREKNKEKAKEYNQQYREINKEALNEYDANRRNNLDFKKKSQIYMKKYYQNKIKCNIIDG